MHNQYQLQPAKIIKVVRENPDTTTLYFELKNQTKFQFLAGQFMMIGLAGWGECPISISSNPKFAAKHFSLTIRTVGELTSKLAALKKGETALVRGPFGNGFPEVTKHIILIGGGCGYIPLRSVYEENKKRSDIRIQVFIGCRDENSLVFRKDMQEIKTNHDLHLILEKKILPGYSTDKGFVTELIKNAQLLPNAMAFVCGPPVMYQAVVHELLAKGMKPEDIHLSLEKKMHCGVGLCQHCAIGTKYVCKDGPVFPYSFLRGLPGFE